MDSVIRTAKDALQAKASAFLSAKYSLCQDDEGIDLRNNYLKLLEVICAAEEMGTNLGRQSPLVNAGYAIRTSTMIKQLLSFTKYHRSDDGICAPLNIVVLGAGFDVMGLAALLSLENIHVIEIDLPPIVAAKKAILSNPKIRKILATNQKETVTTDDQEHLWRLTYASGSSYTLISGDLQELPTLKETLSALPVLNNQSSTLVLSELVLAYIPPEHSDALLQWLCSNFLHNSPGSALVLYEPIGKTSVDVHGCLAVSVTQGYQQAYFDRFQAKLERGRSPQKSTTTDQQQSLSMFYPIAGSAKLLTTKLAPFYVSAITAEKASFRIMPLLHNRCPEMFDEHTAALCLYLRSYCLACVFDDSAPTILSRVMCPWTSLVDACVDDPLFYRIPSNPISSTALQNKNIWITPIHSHDENQVRSLFSQCYEHLFNAYPSVQKMAKTALKKDLAASSSLADGGNYVSFIGSYYHQRHGVFLVAVTESQKDNKTSTPFVVGSIGVRRCDANEKGIRAKSLNATYEIHRLFVHSDYRSQGVARQLLHQALQRLISRRRTDNDRPFVLATTLVLLDGANRFYEQQGFQIVEETNVANLQLRTYGKHFEM